MMFKKFLLVSVAAILLADAAAAQSSGWKHQVSFGMGDPLAECLFYRADPHWDYSGIREGVEFMEKSSYHHLPHFFVEYYYTFKPWLSVGGMVDVGSFTWKNVRYAGGSNTPVSSEKQNCVNLSLLPSVRFTYFRREHVWLFSTVRLGVDINMGTEKDYKGRHTAAGVCLNPTLIGVGGGSGHWFGTFELGLMAALADTVEIFMAGSKLVSVSVGYKF